MLRRLTVATVSFGIVGVLGALGPLGMSDFNEPSAMALAPDNDDDLDSQSQVAALVAWEAAPGVAPPAALSRVHRVRPGETLASILSGAALSPSETSAAVAALRKVYDPRRDLDIGDELTLTFEPDEAGQAMRIARIVFPIAFDRSISVTRQRDSFEAKRIQRQVERRLVRIAGQINDSLYQAAQNAGLPTQTLNQLIRIFSYDVDFQRDLQPGDTFEVLFEQVTDELGRAVHSGDVQYAALSLSGDMKALYRFSDPLSEVDYYNDKGESMRKALLRTPVDGARLSSGFGRRINPVLGYTAMHAGVDFAAMSGTPIFAAGDGVVEEIGPKGSYGNYLRVRHSGGMATAYAHISRFARGIKDGARVRQGDVIAYVGSTGRSTGPHLHFEVLRDGRQVNPVGLNLPGGRKLAGAELLRFAALRSALQRQFNALGTAVLADAEPTGSRRPARQGR
ncbi:MAG: M23 family peptidase [Alphaproteobacteria bacterium]|nr:M23 family peptidase [Alphaproteobacteria bacterium]